MLIIMPKVSVIVPVYGVERYMERCARSLFEQTLDDIEFIFVDDCSPDRSLDILNEVLEEYADRQLQTQIVRLDQNGGLPNARKVGLRLATGNYIIHCDSDDWVERDMYRAMYEKAIKTNADIVVCDFMVTDGDSFNERKEACHTTEPMQFMENCLLRKDHWALWNKLFKREAYSQVVHPQEAMGEDMATTIQLVWKCQVMAYIPEPYYNYYYNPDSITKTRTIDACVYRYKQLIANAHIVLDFLEEKGLSEEWRDVLVFYKNTIRAVLYPVVWKKEYYQIWNGIFPSLNREVLFSKHVSLADKLRVILTIFHLYPRKQHRAQ